ncbi:hypothetical protein RE6C_01752 [Rhodopirellula europaea 6C]|uniref:Uncharacterized protein n=1 Tax=Rhodopirellula europaea 6C TaxID=1263867 RepID=M2A7Q9_9BACT|nr:hypothetical protein RE6C_01752 [Rhodopirellula europaea 6C]
MTISHRKPTEDRPCYFQGFLLLAFFRDAVSPLLFCTSGGGSCGAIV